MCRINPKVDFAFKKLFGSEENKCILMAFINSVLEDGSRAENKVFEPITSIILKNPYNLADYRNGKMSILDIKAQDGNDVWYDIEMQVAEQKFFDKRALYYWGKVYTDQLASGQIYTDLRKTIGINILDFNILDEAEYHNTYRIFNVNSHKELSDQFEMHFIELKKFTKKLPEVKSALERWATFLNKAYEYEQNKIPAELSVDDNVKKAIDCLDVMSLNGEERKYYENDLKRFMVEQATLATARQNGIEEGIEQGKSDLIIKLLQKKFKEVPEKYLEKLKTLPAIKLDRIGDDIFDLENIVELETYF